MALLTPIELLDMLIMTAAAGFIFMDAFRPPADPDPVAHWRNQSDWKQRFGYAAMLVAPPLLLHELAHKFVAMSYGLEATFHAAYTWLGIGVLIKLINFPFLFMVPAYVSILGEATAGQHALIAFAGPGVHLALLIASLLVLRLATLSAKWERFWQYTKIINGFLFVFNMIPIHPFDGAKVFQGLLGLF